jgi:predicted O-linked N-acetylglucosamine transferase (SPINDLY family)
MPDLSIDRLADARQRAEAALRAFSTVHRDAPGDAGEEGRRLQEAYEAMKALAEAGTELPPAAIQIFQKVVAHDLLQRLGRNVSPHMTLARVGVGREARLALLRQRRDWGAAVEAAAGSGVAPAPRPAGGRLRVGFLSNELRQTNVGVFAWPLFEHRDRERVELFAYSAHPGPADGIQQVFTQWTDGWRQQPGASARKMASIIAADSLDVLIELGDPYGWEVCSHRPAPVQVSWVGYPNSVGLSAIDYIVLDPYVMPDDPDMLLERTLVMPHCWKAMSEAYFEAEPTLPHETPEARNGAITFGTMNNPYKYSPSCLDLWARTTAAVPGSRFLFVRPEGSAPIFRDNITAAFAARGVAPERVMFAPVRGRHLPWYNEIDICLDTLPLTGGTTSCETLWMGVPLVTLLGEALFERLSYSLLANAGLADLAARTPEAFVETAVALAADRPRRVWLKRNLRDQIRALPLGQPQLFARDFYRLMERAAETIPEGA